MSRLITKAQLGPLPWGSVLVGLPKDHFIIDPTKEELQIIDLFVQQTLELEKKYGVERIVAECQSNEPPKT